MESSDEQRCILETGKIFIEKKIKPISNEIDEEECFPADIFRSLGEVGLLGIPFPEEFGGVNSDFGTHIAFITEMAIVCPSIAMAINAHSGLVCYMLNKYGSKRQKEKYLKPLLMGKSIGAFGLTEPNAGSDITGIQTYAEKKDDHYLLNGSKIFITNANVADIFIIAAKTVPGKHSIGMGLFIAEKEMGGIDTTGKKERKLGMNAADTGAVYIQNLKIPKDNVVGMKDHGLKLLHDNLVTSRIGMAAIALGIAKSAKAHCVRYVGQRKQFGKYLSQMQFIKGMLADMQVNISAANLLVQHAVHVMSMGNDYTIEASMAKLFSSEIAMKTTKDAIQILGGYGYSRDFHVERFFRDAKLTEIGDGTSEMQRLIIADEMLKRESRVGTNV